MSQKFLWSRLRRGHEGHCTGLKSSYMLALLTFLVTCKVLKLSFNAVDSCLLTLALLRLSSFLLTLALNTRSQALRAGQLGIKLESAYRLYSVLLTLRFIHT